MKNTAVASLVWVLGATIILGGQSRTPTAADRKILENELALASRPISYMLINLRDKTVEVKSRGMVLKSWPIAKWKVWGKPVPVKNLTLKKKSALKTPKRTNITPGKEESGQKKDKAKDALDLGILELKDMPVHFRLDFGEGVAISVRPKTKRFWPSIVNIGRAVSWYLYLPLKTVWNTFENRPFTEIELVFPSEKDAQGVYWTFLDGHSTLFVK